MVDGVIDNIFLVNAPAGSGKTTWIRRQVENHILKNPNDNVLCITYTNRAAEELGSDLDKQRVYIGTIHSFINDFIGNFYKNRDIINLYWETYKDQIAERIENRDANAYWTDSNERYKEKYGDISLEVIYSNIKSVSYNETSFNSLYRGALSHDDLISFTKKAVDKFPIIKKKIYEKYQLIFIDEYQDTVAEILDIFYTSMLGEKGKLYLLGDKMQQIYKNYNGEFEEQFKTFNKSINLTTNYRTTPKIVSILNAIYNDHCLEQKTYYKNQDSSMAFLPRVKIVTNVEKTVSEFVEEYKDALVLYLSNKKRFYNIGIKGLYDAYCRMEKYGVGRKFSAVDILTKDDARENDIILSFLFLADKIVRNCNKERVGEVLNCIKNYSKYFNSSKYTVKVHNDKKRLKKLLDKVVVVYGNPKTTIELFLDVCLKHEFITKDYYSAIVDDLDYQLVKDVSVNEVKKLIDYLNDPRISTQHGVKGESHDTVVFVAEDGKNEPVVHMSKFFKLWSDMNITLTEFESFYYKYSEMIREIENIIGIKCCKLNKETYMSVESIIENKIKNFDTDNSDNIYYNNLLKDKIDKYLMKPNVTKVKACLKESDIYGLLSAYRLFYVGCSRARKNLMIVVDKDKVAAFEEKLCTKFESCGFEVL